LFLDKRKLYTEAYHHPQDQCHDKIFKESQPPDGSVGSIKNEKEEDIGERDGTSSDERNFKKEVESDS
jgi:hypothetical protein